jgi:hypothetical protein
VENGAMADPHAFRQLLYGSFEISSTTV